LLKGEEGEGPGEGFGKKIALCEKKKSRNKKGKDA